MREKAEQMAKNAEMKIQKAQTKEAKYQQWLENKKQTDPNFRDYDENPLIIKSYEKFFALTLFISSLCLSAILFYFIMNLFYKDWYASGLEFLSITMVAYIVIVYIIHKFKFKNHKIKFTNRYIEFYDDGKLKRQCEIVRDKLVKSFCMATGTHRESLVIKISELIFLLGIIILSKGKFILIMVIFYFSAFLIKLFFYFFINVSLKGFKIFPFIRIATANITIATMSERYFMIYLYNDEIYKEVKKYFLQKNIDIDKLPKDYWII